MVVDGTGGRDCGIPFKGCSPNSVLDHSHQMSTKGANHPSLSSNGKSPMAK
jgi:hypothetical protein